jgi:hypothetical protein
MQVLTTYQLSASSALFNYRTFLFISCLKEFPSQKMYYLYKYIVGW